MASPRLEICVDTVAGLEAARQGGAERIELCAALALGGLTPPASLIRAAAAQPLPVHLLAPPREGDFSYGPAEQAMVADDIRAAAEAGLAGVVIGASGADRRLDVPVLATWIKHARALGERRGTPLAITLHRAFDLTPRPRRRAGRRDHAWLRPGADVRRRAARKRRAGPDRRAPSSGRGRVAILPGGGVTPALVPELRAIGVGEVHVSARTRMVIEADSPERHFVFAAEQSATTDAALVARLRAALDA